MRVSLDYNVGGGAAAADGWTVVPQAGGHVEQVFKNMDVSGTTAAVAALPPQWTLCLRGCRSSAGPQVLQHLVHFCQITLTNERLPDTWCWEDSVQFHKSVKVSRGSGEKRPAGLRYCDLCRSPQWKKRKSGTTEGKNHFQHVYPPKL